MGLKYSDLDREKGVINVRRQVIGKTSKEKKMGSLKGKESEQKERIVPVPNIFFDIVEYWRLSRFESGYYQKSAIKGNEDVIFTNRWGDLRSDNTIRKYCRNFLQELGLWHEGTVFHGLRRTYATFMSRAGVDDKVISKLLGHEEENEDKSCAVARKHYIKPDNEKMEEKKKEAVKLFMDYAGATIVNSISLDAA